MLLLERSKRAQNIENIGDGGCVVCLREHATTSSGEGPRQVKEGSGEIGTDFGASKTLWKIGSARVGSNPIGVAVALQSAANVVAPKNIHRNT